MLKELLNARYGAFAKTEKEGVHVMFVEIFKALDEFKKRIQALESELNRLKKIQKII